MSRGRSHSIIMVREKTQKYVVILPQHGTYIFKLVFLMTRPPWRFFSVYLFVNKSTAPLKHPPHGWVMHLGPTNQRPLSIIFKLTNKNTCPIGYAKIFDVDWPNLIIKPLAGVKIKSWQTIILWKSRMGLLTAIRRQLFFKSIKHWYKRKVCF